MTHRLERDKQWAMKIMKGLRAPHIWGKADRAGTAQPAEASGEKLFNVNEYLMAGWKEDGSRLCSGAPRDRRNGHKLKHGNLCV